MQKSFLVFLFCICSVAIIKAQSVTYKDVEPIFFQKCVACHRAGDAAPFSLMSYDDIVKRLSFVKEVLEKNYMPPWKADVHYRDFANNRMLSEEQKNTILKWIENKAPKGKYKEKDNEQRNAMLGITTLNRKPDLTFKIDSPFIVKGDNIERFIIFKIPFEFADTHNVEAIEFYSNNKKIVHHINYGFYEVEDPSIDINGGRSYLNATEDDRSAPDPFILFNRKMTYYTGWIPGTSFENYPKDFGWVLPKRGVLLLTTHYSAIPVDESSIVGVNIFFRKEPVKREVKVISFGSGGVGEKDIYPKLLLYPGKISTHHLRVKTSGDQSLLAIWPHMHFLGKEFFAYAVTPTNDTINLVHISDWDSRWQELYKLKQLIKIPKGSIVHMDCTYDNTVNNPFNPNSPPAPVFSFGDMSSKNEMMTLLLLYTAYQEGDEELKLEN